MCRCASRFVLAITILTVFRSGSGSEQPAEQAAPFQWLAASGETTGIKYPTHRLESLSLRTEGSSPVEIEKEEVKIDAQTTKIIRRTYMTSVNGERQLTEMIEEEIRRSPGDRVHAVRTTSRKDSGGRFSPIQQEIQEMAPLGADSYQIKKTLLLPGYNSVLVEKERVQQTERRKSDTSVEIDRVLYMNGLNGAWSATERRVSQNSLGKEQTRTEEQVYANDVNNRLALTQQLEVTEWTDSAGKHLQSLNYVLNPAGKMQLDSRVILLRAPQRNGRQQTTEILEKPGPTAPNEGLKLVRKIVENLQFLSPNETERQLEVLEPDLNGGMRSIHSQQGIEVK